MTSQDWNVEHHGQHADWPSGERSTSEQVAPNQARQHLMQSEQLGMPTECHVLQVVTFEEPSATKAVRTATGSRESTGQRAQGVEEHTAEIMNAKDDFQRLIQDSHQPIPGITCFT